MRKDEMNKMQRDFENNVKTDPEVMNTVSFTIVFNHQMCRL